MKLLSLKTYKEIQLFFQNKNNLFLYSFYMASKCTQYMIILLKMWSPPPPSKILFFAPILLRSQESLSPSKMCPFKNNAPPAPAPIPIYVTWLLVRLRHLPLKYVTKICWWSKAKWGSRYVWKPGVSAHFHIISAEVKPEWCHALLKKGFNLWCKKK